MLPRDNVGQPRASFADSMDAASKADILKHILHEYCLQLDSLLVFAVSSLDGGGEMAISISDHLRLLLMCLLVFPPFVLCSLLPVHLFVDIIKTLVLFVGNISLAMALDPVRIRTVSLQLPLYLSPKLRLSYLGCSSP